MNTRPILIIWGEPNSIFSEIFFKSIKNYKSKKPIILIGSKKLMIRQLEKLKFDYKENLFNYSNDFSLNLKTDKINFINVNYDFNKPFEKITQKSNNFINKCFLKAFDIIKKNKISGLINGPISKKSFLKDKYQGVTEFLSSKFKISDNFTMLIYNKGLSVAPITTHLPIKKINTELTKAKIIKKVNLINKFCLDFFLKKPKIAICGLNPHCENFYSKISEEQSIIIPAINFLKKKNINVNGPFSADTIFIKKIRKNYDIVVGMYHDQVLAPIKTIYGFNSFNLTIGLPFLRLSPDHGPNENMIGENKSSPQSLINSIKFLNSIN